MRILTMGVYGYTDKTFRQALQQADVDVFVDTRRRRGVRGAQYSFANSQRLQETLQSLGIPYVHRLDLSPTPEMIRSQDDADHNAKIARHERTHLTPEFRETYEGDILKYFDPREFVASLGSGVESALIFCIEEVPDACHRSILAKRLHDELGGTVEHLVPVNRERD
jgi:uncharacterized protein (DUF488 family)